MLKHFAFSTLTIAILAGISFAQPVKPSIIQITPENPEGLDDVVVTASDYSGSAAHFRTVWQFAVDSGFTIDTANNIALYREYSFPVDEILTHNDTRPNEVNTGITIPNEVLPFDVSIYIRVQYIDDTEAASAFSDPVEVTLQSFTDLNVIFEEDFEDVSVGSIPDGWKTQNFSLATFAGNPGYSEDSLNWSVQDLAFLNTLRYYPGFLGLGDAPNQIPESYFTGFPFVQGKSLHIDSGGYGGGLLDGRIISEEFDLTGINDVVVTFHSDYLQNQDNIAAFEYTLDGGDINGGDTPANDTDLLAAEITGTWNPALYYLDVDDIIFNEESNPDSGISADFTLFQLADGTDFFFEDFTLARQFVDNVEDMAPFIQPMQEENSYIVPFKDNKRFERIRLEGLDNQASVKFALMYMGTFSWYWGIDNFQIWGSGGTHVSEWSLY